MYSLAPPAVKLYISALLAPAVEEVALEAVEITCALNSCIFSIGSNVKAIVSPLYKRSSLVGAEVC